MILQVTGTQKKTLADSSMSPTVLIKNPDGNLSTIYLFSYLFTEIQISQIIKIRIKKKKLNAPYH